MNVTVFRILICGALLLLPFQHIAAGAHKQDEADKTARVQVFDDGLPVEILIPDPALNAVIRDTLNKPNGPLTPDDMMTLTNLSGIFRGITSLQGIGAARNLETLLLDDNHLTNSPSFNELATLNKLSVLDLSENLLTELVLPPGLGSLTKLRIEAGHLARISLPAGLTNLTELRLGSNQLNDLPLPEDMTSLRLVSLYLNQFTNIALPGTLKNLTELVLDGNHISQITLPPGLINLTNLLLGGNQLASLTLPADMTNLVILRLNDNQLTNLSLPEGLKRLVFLFLPGNRLADFSLPPGLSNLGGLYLTGNQLTHFTIPPDITQLSTLLLDGNPLTTLVMPEPLEQPLAPFLEVLRTQGVSIFTYPLAARLVRPRAPIGAFGFGIVGPPGTYTVLQSTSFAEWNVLRSVTNALGSINFTDVTAHSSPYKFYRVFLQNVSAINEPTNLEIR